MKKPAPHQTHPQILKRLRRAEGQIRSIVAMIEAGRPCLDVAQQLQAAESAVREAKKTLIRDHIDQCLDQAATGGRKALPPIEEFKTITKYL